MPPTCTVWATKREVRDSGTAVSSHMDYFPLYYLMVGWSSLVVGGTHAIYAMRLVSALITALLLTAAFTIARRRLGLAALGFVAAATPAAIYWGAVVNPCGLEITSALLTWIAFLSLVRAERDAPGIRQIRVVFAVSAATLVLVRPLGPLWLAMIVGTVLVSEGGLRERISRILRLRSREIRWIAALLAVAVLAAGLWDTTQNTMGIVPETNPHYTYAKGIYITLFQLPDNLGQMVGTVGWDDVPVPTLTNLLWFGVILGLVMLAILFGDRRERLTLLALTATTILFPIAFEAYSGTDYGTGWQGRYSMPLAVGIPILGAEILMRRMSPIVPARISRALVATFGIALAIAYMCQIWWAWRRYAQGIFGHSLGHVVPIHAKWTPPIGWGAFLMLALFGCAALFVALYKSARPIAVDPPAEELSAPLVEAMRDC